MIKKYPEWVNKTKSLSIIEHNSQWFIFNECRVLRTSCIMHLPLGKSFMFLFTETLLSPKTTDNIVQQKKKKWLLNYKWLINFSFGTSNMTKKKLISPCFSDILSWLRKWSLNKILITYANSLKTNQNLKLSKFQILIC